MGRAPCCSQVGLQRGPWTANEDHLLIRYIEWHGEGDWRNLPGKAGLLRCGKSCRLRWLNYLRPTIKRGNISPDEEDLIVRLHRLLGNRWSLIAGRLPGRTDNEIKNYWNSHLSKKLRKRGIDPVTHKPLESNNIGDDYTHENSKASSLHDGQVQIGQNHENQAKESPSTDHQSMQQPVHLPKVNRYISFPPGFNSNNDDSQGMDGHSKKSMQETMDDVRHILDESLGLHTPSNQLDSFYSGMSFKSDPSPESNFCDSVLKTRSPLSGAAMELNEPEHEHHLLHPLIDCYADDNDQGFRNHLQFCNLEGGSEFMIQNIFQDYASLDPRKLSLSDQSNPNSNPSNLEEYGLGYDIQDVQWPYVCAMEGRAEDILTL